MGHDNLVETLNYNTVKNNYSTLCLFNHPILKIKLNGLEKNNTEYIFIKKTFIFNYIKKIK